MTWTIGLETTLSFSCNFPECNREYSETEEGAHSHDFLIEGVMGNARAEGWYFEDEDGDECYCPEHAALRAQELQP